MTTPELTDIADQIRKRLVASGCTLDEAIFVVAVITAMITRQASPDIKREVPAKLLRLLNHIEPAIWGEWAGGPIPGLTAGDGWIPVAERLPESGEKVDAYSFGYDEPVFSAEYHPAHGWHDNETWEFLDPTAHPVTHWRPRPQPPQHS